MLTFLYLQSCTSWEISITTSLFDSIREPIYDHCHTFSEYVLSYESQIQTCTNLTGRYLPLAHLFSQYADLEGENVNVQAQMLSFITTCSSALECHHFWSTTHEASLFFNIRDIFIALKTPCLTCHWQMIRETKLSQKLKLSLVINCTAKTGRIHEDITSQKLGTLTTDVDHIRMARVLPQMIPPPVPHRYKFQN
jgi:hypothetical protein